VQDQTVMIVAAFENALKVAAAVFAEKLETVNE
jgi:hypothetical protein